jgi:hypothetical protein
MERKMSMAQLAKNVEAYDPETDPAKIDYNSLRRRGWPSSVLDCIKALEQPGPYGRTPEAPWKPMADLPRTE